MAPAGASSILDGPPGRGEATTGGVMVTEADLELSDGRTLHIYDTGADGDPLGIRWISHDRPGYGGSTPQAGRRIGSVAADVTAIADALGIESFAVLGH